MECGRVGGDRWPGHGVEVEAGGRDARHDVESQRRGPHAAQGAQAHLYVRREGRRECNCNGTDKRAKVHARGQASTCVGNMDTAAVSEGSSMLM